MFSWHFLIRSLWLVTLILIHPRVSATQWESISFESKNLVLPSHLYTGGSSSPSTSMGHKEHMKPHTGSSRKPRSTSARWSQRMIWLLSSSWRLAASSTTQCESHPKDTRNAAFYFNIVANIQWNPLLSDLESTPANTRKACGSSLHQRAKQRKPRFIEPGAGLPSKVSWSPFTNT